MTDALHCHGLLVDFLSYLHNKRVDEYGGGVDGRLRMPLEVISGGPGGLPAAAEAARQSHQVTLKDLIKQQRHIEKRDKIFILPRFFAVFYNFQQL